MKITAEKHNQFQDQNGVGYITFRVDNFGHYKKLEGIEGDDKLSLDIEKARGQRSLDQNRKMWALIRDIDKATNGYLSNDQMTIYANALRQAGVKSEQIIVDLKAEKDLRRMFRAVEFIQPYDDEKAVFRCYYGSSTFTTKEMSNLIEVLLIMASEAGLDTGYWREVLG